MGVQTSALKIGIVGAGVGGLTAAIALRKLGHEVVVFEQAIQFGRVGADINLTPNSARALDGLGLAAVLRASAAFPTHRLSRMWNSGEVTSRIEMQQAAEERFGARQYTMHRADLLSALESALPAGCMRLGKRLTKITEGVCTQLAFADGTSESVDALVGGDGIHSVVRGHLFGPDQPRFTGNVCFRGVIPIERVRSIPNIEAFTKWWGPKVAQMIVQFPISAGREIFVFSTADQENWLDESWSVPGNVAELRRHYADFHPDARALLDALDAVVKQALYDRDPLPTWTRGAITLLGDACHPMLPYMAQGAGMAIEDGVVLARALAGVGKVGVGNIGVPAALKRSEAARLARTARVQRASRANNWLREGNNGDWLYGYDAWRVPID